MNHHVVLPDSPTPSMRRPVCVKNSFFCSLVLVRHVALSQAASVAIPPSALVCGAIFPLGASWAFSFQHVLQPENRPLLPSLGRGSGTWPQSPELGGSAA